MSANTPSCMEYLCLFRLPRTILQPWIAGVLFDRLTDEEIHEAWDRWFAANSNDDQQPESTSFDIVAFMRQYPTCNFPPIDAGEHLSDWLELMSPSHNEFWHHDNYFCCALAMYCIAHECSSLLLVHLLHQPAWRNVLITMNCELIPRFEVGYRPISTHFINGKASTSLLQLITQHIAKCSSNSMQQQLVSLFEDIASNDMYRKREVAEQPLKLIEFDPTNTRFTRYNTWMQTTDSVSNKLITAELIADIETKGLTAIADFWLNQAAVWNMINICHKLPSSRIIDSVPFCEHYATIRHLHCHSILNNHGLGYYTERASATTLANMEPIFVREIRILDWMYSCVSMVQPMKKVNATSYVPDIGYSLPVRTPLPPFPDIPDVNDEGMSDQTVNARSSIAMLYITMFQNESTIGSSVHSRSVEPLIHLMTQKVYAPYNDNRKERASIQRAGKNEMIRDVQTTFNELWRLYVKQVIKEVIKKELLNDAKRAVQVSKKQKTM